MVWYGMRALNRKSYAYIAYIAYLTLLSTHHTALHLAFLFTCLLAVAVYETGQPHRIEGRKEGWMDG